jgi:hypothetical protein
LVILNTRRDALRLVGALYGTFSAADHPALPREAIGKPSGAAWRDRRGRPVIRGSQRWDAAHRGCGERARSFPPAGLRVAYGHRASASCPPPRSPRGALRAPSGAAWRDSARAAGDLRGRGRTWDRSGRERTRAHVGSGHPCARRPPRPVDGTRQG